MAATNLVAADVTVIGAGITGSVAACLLQDRGLHVRLVDQHGAPMQGASRWNEGKLHLGYTYTGTESLETARLMLEGTARFEAILQAVCGKTFEQNWWSQPVIYVVDPASIFEAEELWARANSVERLLREYTERCDGLRRFADVGLERLTPAEGAALSGLQRIAAAWRTGERSLSPRPVAQMIVDAVERRAIEVTKAKVVSIRRQGAAWEVACEGGAGLHSRSILNCSWESRALLDRPLERSTASVSIRYKVALFGSSQEGWGSVHPSTRILGPFGDVTPYGDGDVYLSWYPAGLLAQSDDGVPPAIPIGLDEAHMQSATLAGLGLRKRLGPNWTVAGGYVVAAGKGHIGDPKSSLHHRHQPDAWLLGPRYVSVDSGKYCLGPLLAERAADLLMSGWNQE